MHEGSGHDDVLYLQDPSEELWGGVDDVAVADSLDPHHSGSHRNCLDESGLCVELRNTE